MPMEGSLMTVKSVAGILVRMAAASCQTPARQSSNRKESPSWRRSW
jgi:hypothetical protein